MDTPKLIEIKLDKLGNKITAIVEYNGQHLEGTTKSLVDYINNGNCVKYARVANNELFYISNNKKRMDLTGRQFTKWEVLEYLGNKHYKCRCTCEKHTIRSVQSSHLVNGVSNGCCNTTLIDLTNKRFGEWHVLYRDGNTYNWICECSCSTPEKPVIKSISGENLRRGTSLSCGHDNRKDLVGRIYGSLLVKRYIGMKNGHSIYECECQCENKTILNVYSGNLLTNQTVSCGRCNRTDIQIEYTSSEEKFNALLANEVIKLKHKLTVDYVAKLIGFSNTHTHRLIKKFNAEDYIEDIHSKFETDLKIFIQSLGYDIQQNIRILDGKEIDIYIPNESIGIEANGIYYHDNNHRPYNYHQYKTFLANKYNIDLIHIFEHEWHKDKDKIKDFLKQRLGVYEKILYARMLSVKLVDTDVARIFLDTNHLQGYVSATISLGLYDNNELVMMMTFGQSRYDKNYDMELLRLCTKRTYKVIGGADKLFKYFLKNNTVASVVSYSSLAKFSGKVYEKLGFKFESYTQPDYVYINSNTFEVLSRQHCTKQELIKQGYDSSMTEKEIMYSRGYLQIYGCGNAKYVYTCNT